MKQTKNAIISSVLALVMCVSCFIGTTFAWFTDMATSKGNIIQTGDLDVEMYWSNEMLVADSADWEKAAGKTVFNFNNWYPGYTDVKYIKVANEGDINLKWELLIEANGSVTPLSDVIDVYYITPVTSEVTTLDGFASAGNLTTVMTNKKAASGTLDAGKDTILAIALHMDENAGNAYNNGMSLCDAGFSLKLVATQLLGEFNYAADENEEQWFNGINNFSATASLDGVDTFNGALKNDVTIGDVSGVNATLPADVKLADDADSLKLTVTKAENNGNLTLGEGDAAKSLDVHIAGISENNDVPMIVNLGAILAPGMSDTSLKLYHIENDVPVLMTRVASVSDFAIHNQYTYDEATGEVTIFVASFSVFSLVQTTADVWDGTSSDKSWYTENASEFTLTTAAQFVGFRDLVDGGNTFEGKTVKLGKSIDLNNILFDPIGKGYDHLGGQVFKGTFDGQGNVVYNLYQQGWDLEAATGVDYTYSTAGGGLFASIKDSTIKNLAVSGANIVFECIDMGVVVGYAQGACHFENIVVTNSTIANYERATGAVVGEVCFGPYGTDTSKGYSHTFKNITVDSSVVVSSLWGDFDTLCGGVIGSKWGDATVKMENVTTAATLDVFSDVTAAYQWYAYRRCGMLIGYTEQESPKKALNAAAEFLTCENVKVYYGDWVAYTYYEFEDQESGTGRSYPWVRAEEGLNNPAFSNVRYGVPTYGGVKVNRDTARDLCSDWTPIIFNQLYGGGQGVYGCATHDGVKTYDTNSKTVYIYNDEGWTNLKYEYWFAHGDDKWSTLVEPITIVAGPNGLYEITVPSYAAGFKIIADGNTSVDFVIETLTDKVTYKLDATPYDFSGGTEGGGNNTETPGTEDDDFEVED